MKPVDVKSSTYIDSSKEIADKISKFKIGSFVRISKYKTKKNCQKQIKKSLKLKK